MPVATVGRVIEINPIPDAERIESLTVICGSCGKWVGTAQKSVFHVGDLANVYLPDALLPKTDEFAFMEKHSYRVKPARFLGVPSECLIMPLKHGSEIGEDVMRLAGVEKYEKPISASMKGEIIANFPSFIPRTDEPNFQASSHLVDAMRGKAVYTSVKCDGSSMSVFYKDGHFGVCSRECEWAKSDTNTMWNLAHKYKLETILEGMSSFALQMEVVGPRINKNTMKLAEPDIRVFNGYDIAKREYLNGSQIRDLCKANHLPFVPVSGWNFVLPPETTDEQLRVMAQTYYESGAKAEGIVIRPMEEMSVMGERCSVKILNLLYKE